MISKLILPVAAAALAAAPIAAQAAPERFSTPVAEEENLRGGLVLPIIIGIGLIIAIYLAIDSEDEGRAPLSP